MSTSMPNYGDVIYVKRGLYDHYGVYSGDGNVIHYVKASDNAFDGVISETPVQQFVGNSKVGYICQFDALGRQLHDGKAREPKSILGAVKDLYDLGFGEQATIYSADETVTRARNCIGTRNYDLFGQNCEHFAVWCKTGVAKSDQVENVVQCVLRVAEELFVRSLKK